MTNINLLKSKMALVGLVNFTTDLMQILEISWTSASQKINGKADFTQKEITTLKIKLDLKPEDISNIFTSMGAE